MILSRKKRAQVNTMLVKIILALIVLGIGIYLAYTYVYTGGENIGALGSCSSQKGECKPSSTLDNHRCFKGIGCPEDNNEDNIYCCIPENGKKSSGN
jgi:cell division protein FtsN